MHDCEERGRDTWRGNGAESKEWNLVNTVRVKK